MFVSMFNSKGELRDAALLLRPGLCPSQVEQETIALASTCRHPQLLVNRPTRRSLIHLHARMLGLPYDG
jgi:hypothetical protein